MGIDRSPKGGLCQPRDYGIECGDELCWTGHEIYLKGKNTMSVDYAKHFSRGFGLVRSPDPHFTDNGFGAYYKNPWDGVISRDQSCGFLAGITALGDWRAALKYVIHHAAWLWLFTYNTRDNGKDPGSTPWKRPDFTGPNIWALEIRALGWVGLPLYPLLWLFDAHDFFNAILYRFKRKIDPINFTIRMIVAKEVKPTLFSLLTFHWVANKAKLVEELKYYWCGWRGHCSMVELYEKKLFSSKRRNGAK